MLVRSELFQQIGGFDPRFFLYFEETDLCLRVLRAGMEIWAVGESTASHLGGVSAKQAGTSLTQAGTGGCIVEYFYPSRFYYLIKNFGWFAAVSSELIARGIERLRPLIKTILRRKRSNNDSAPAKAFLHLPKRVD